MKVSLKLMSSIVESNLSDTTGYISREIDEIYAIYFSYRYYTTTISSKVVRLFETKSLESLRADVYSKREYLYNIHSNFLQPSDFDLLVVDLYSYHPVITKMDKNLVERRGIGKFKFDDNDCI